MLTVGILGGMGPMATADLFTKIVQCTPANIDQEHPKIVVYNNPQIPSRINAIINGTESPVSELIRSARFLEQAGADLIAMPCNTAHYWYEEIQAAVDIKVVNMIENTARRIKVKNQCSVERPAMLFATAATVKTGIYNKVFKDYDMPLLETDVEEQYIISSAIDQVKAGKMADNPFIPQVQMIINRYCARGVKSFIAGCTEVPLLFRFISGDYRPIDPTELLAQEIVRLACVELSVVGQDNFV